MAYLFFIFAIIFMAGMGGAAYWLRVRRTRSDDIAEILNDPYPLAFWTYTPQEWQQAVADEFSWGRVDGGECQIRICKSGFYVSQGSQRRVFELETGPKVVTFAGYLGMERNPLKLRVRWKVVTYDRNGNKQTNYHRQDYRIPVPLREKESAQAVVDFFTARLEQNLNAYTELVPDDEPISLFGKDSF